MLSLIVLAAAVYLISAPLRARRRPDDAHRPQRREVAELEAERDAKYREIRDAELDLRTGKLSDDDYARARRLAARGGGRDPAPAGRGSTGDRSERIPSRRMTAILDLVQVVLCVGLIFLILMHSGKDAGLSGAFGVGTGAGPLGGGSLVERNLNRWTVVFAVAVRRQHDRPDPIG